MTNKLYNICYSRTKRSWECFPISGIGIAACNDNDVRQSFVGRFFAALQHLTDTKDDCTRCAHCKNYKEYAGRGMFKCPTCEGD